MLAPLHAGHATAHEHIKEKMVGTAKYKTRPKTGTKRRMKFPVGAAIEVAGAGYRYLRTRRMRKKRLGVKITPTAAGSTMSYYTAGTKTMPKMMRDMFKTNRVYDTSALSSFRIDSNVYGRQFTGVRQLYSAANFNTDVIRGGNTRANFRSNRDLVVILFRFRINNDIYKHGNDNVVFGHL